MARDRISGAALEGTSPAVATETDPDGPSSVGKGLWRRARWRIRACRSLLSRLASSHSLSLCRRGRNGEGNDIPSDRLQAGCLEH